MIEIASTIAAILQPLTVPLLTVVAIGVWKLDRRLVSVETIIERELNNEDSRRA